MEGYIDKSTMKWLIDNTKDTPPSNTLLLIKQASPCFLLEGSTGLKDIQKSTLACLMDFLSFWDVLALSRVCKSLHETTQFLSKISPLVTSFTRNHFALSILLDTRKYQDITPTPVPKLPQHQNKVQFLLYGQWPSSEENHSRSLFKVILPNSEILLVGQSLTDSKFLCIKEFGVYYQGEVDYMYYIDFDGDEDCSMDPTAFFMKYCEVLSLDTPQDVYHFFQYYGKIDAESDIFSVEGNPGTQSHDFDLFFEFGRDDAAYFRFLDELGQIVSHQHILDQLCEVLAKHFRLSYYLPSRDIWKKRIVSSNYYGFPAVKEMNTFLQSTSLTDINGNLFYKCVIKAHFLVYLKQLEQYSKLEIVLRLMEGDNQGVVVNLYVDQEEIANMDSLEDIAFLLNNQLGFHFTPKEWKWVFFILTNSLLDTLVNVTLPLSESVKWSRAEVTYHLIWKGKK